MVEVTPSHKRKRQIRLIAVMFIIGGVAIRFSDSTPIDSACKEYMSSKGLFYIHLAQAFITIAGGAYIWWFTNKMSDNYIRISGTTIEYKWPISSLSLWTVNKIYEGKANINSVELKKSSRRGSPFSILKLGEKRYLIIDSLANNKTEFEIEFEKSKIDSAS